MGFFGSHTEKMIADGTQDIRKSLFDPDATVIINMNVTCGYFNYGPFRPQKSEEIISNIIRTNEYLLHSRHLFVTDVHTEKSAEFDSFPRHSSDDDAQTILGAVASRVPDPETVGKNCANAMLSNEFLRWFAENKKTLDSYILIGALTDVDIYQLALSLRSYFNERNEKARIAVVKNACATFHSQAHNAADFSSFALYSMMLNGISILSI